MAGCLVRQAVEPFLAKEKLLQVEQLGRFGVVRRPWEGCRGRPTFSEGPQCVQVGRACAQGVGQSPAWQAHLQEGRPVASDPVL